MSSCVISHEWYSDIHIVRVVRCPSLDAASALSALLASVLSKYGIGSNVQPLELPALSLYIC